jgi:hypothetical protein
LLIVDLIFENLQVHIYSLPHFVTGNYLSCRLYVCL